MSVLSPPVRANRQSLHGWLSSFRALSGIQPEGRYLLGISEPSLQPIQGS